MTTPTYDIYFNGECLDRLDNKAMAYLSYRAWCQSPTECHQAIELKYGNQLLHKKPANQPLDTPDNFTANDILQTVVGRFGLDERGLMQLFERHYMAGYFKDKVTGWFKPSNDKEFVPLYHDELALILAWLLNDLPIKTAQNIKNLRLSLGLSQSELAIALGLNPKSSPISKWETGKQVMPDRLWYLMQTLKDD